MSDHDPNRKTDILHTIDQTLRFYGKSLDDLGKTFWLNALAGKSAAAVRNACLAYTASGKYAPKPVDILELITENAQQAARSTLPAPEPVTSTAEVRDAWTWFIHLTSKGGPAEGLFERSVPDETTPEQQDRYLLLVNRQARRQNMPEAVPDQFKLAEVWA